MALITSFNYDFPNYLERMLGRDSDEAFNYGDRVGVNVPAVNILENNESFLLQVAAPGYVKEDFNIQVANNNLILSGKKQNSRSDQEKVRFNQREFNYGAWQRTFTLPKTVETDSIQAQYENGILSVFVPKKEEAKVRPPKSIEIK